jgi:hypothetical protein
MRVCALLMIGFITIIMRQPAPAQTIQSYGRDGKLFHVGGDDTEVQKAYLLSKQDLQGQDGFYVKGQIRVEYYTQSLGSPSSGRNTRSTSLAPVIILTPSKFDLQMEAYTEKLRLSSRSPILIGTVAR